MTENGITRLTSVTFDHAVADAPTPVLVEFWAEGCRPCRALIPILDEIGRDHAEQLRVATVRLDDNPDLARRYQIMALPTVILFASGRESLRMTTATTKAQLLQEIHPLLARPADEGDARQEL